MPIYTKKGDSGTTSLFGGKRVDKNESQVIAYGELDELSSYIGLVITLKVTREDKKTLTSIQRNLYQIMSVLSGAPPTMFTSIQKQTKVLESEIDKKEKDLKPLHRFILPQGTKISCYFQISRTVCRRGERSLVTYIKNTHKDTQQYSFEMLAYINRLSDYFFVMARWYNKNATEVST